MRASARLLRREKIFDVPNLPYPTQLVPMSVIAAVLGTRLGEDAVRRKVASWYWCGVFGELYGSSTETRFANDVREVIARHRSVVVVDARTIGEELKGNALSRVRSHC